MPHIHTKPIVVGSSASSTMGQGVGFTVHLTHCSGGFEFHVLVGLLEPVFVGFEFHVFVGLLLDQVLLGLFPVPTFPPENLPKHTHLPGIVHSTIASS